MKLFFANKGKNNTTTYTYELLKHLARKNNHDIVDSPKKADYVMLSLTGYQEFDKLVSLRKKVGSKKIIVGGHIGFIPMPLLAYADYVNVGQGFDLFRDMNNTNDLSELNYIAARGKDTNVISNQNIYWGDCPVVQISKQSYSSIYSVGCKNKCKFCYTSWHNKYQETTRNISRTIDKIPKNSNLYVITNDYNGPKIHRKVSDASVSNYLKHTNRYKGIQTIRTGIESPSEATRRKLGKPISTEAIQEMLKRTKKNKQNIKLFMMCGLDSFDLWKEFIDIFPSDISKSPKLEIILNYFEPMIGTPMENFNLFDLIELNIGKFQYLLKRRVHRVLVWRLTLKPIFTIFRTILSRCSAKEAPYIWSLRNIRNLSELYNAVDELGLGSHIKSTVHKNPVVQPYKYKHIN